MKIIISLLRFILSKVIYITRNPKDVSVSYFHFVKLNTQSGFVGKFENFLKMFMEGNGKAKLDF